MAIFRLNEDCFEKIEQTKFSNEGILERQHIQNALKKQISVISPDILVIAEEFAEWSDSRRRIDLLGIDKDANIVVIELKRNETGEHMELQAIRYAAMVSTLTFKRAVEIFQKHLEAIGKEENAEEEILGFLGWTEERADFASDVKIILVASDFSKELTTSVLWLNEKELDIKCFRLIPYKLNDKIIIDVQEIIPLPEAKDYQNKIKEQKEERREARKSSRDYTRYSCNGHGDLTKRGLVLFVWCDYLSNNPGLTMEKLQSDFPKNIRGAMINTKVNAREQQKRDENNNIRYFIDDNAIVTIDNVEYVISNQWNKDNIIKFIEHAMKLGYVIEAE